MVTGIIELKGSLNRIILVFVVISCIASSKVGAQSDTTKNLKNTIRYNISNTLIFGWKFNVIGYERVITDHQSASFNIGRTAFPSLVNFKTDSLGITGEGHDRGMNLSVDYRFYLKGENKYKAPRGIYVGPYYAFNSFSRDLKWEVNTENFTGDVNGSLNISAHFVGAQLGYQFVFWNRLALDLILMGPGWWSFNLRTTFDTSMPPEDEAAMLEKLNEILKEKFPGSDIVIQGGGFHAKKSDWTSTAGFRYMINIGIRF